MNDRRLTIKFAAMGLAILCVAALGGCSIFAGGYNSEIGKLREIEEPALKCPRLIAFLEVGPRLIGYPALNAQEALIECGNDAIPFLKTEIQDREYNDRARRLMLEAVVEIIDREAIYMLLKTARDRAETDSQRVEAIELLVRLNARHTRPAMRKIFIDDTQPRRVRRAAKRAYNKFEY